jgi:hypothetical protein
MYLQEVFEIFHEIQEVEGIPDIFAELRSLYLLFFSVFFKVLVSSEVISSFLLLMRYLI